MSYSSQAQLSSDADFIARVAACAAVEISKLYQPMQWARDHIWWIAAAPGFADAYEYAINSDNRTSRQRPRGDHRRADSGGSAGVGTRDGIERYHMSDVPPDLTSNDYTRIINRDRFVKAQLADRVAALVRENLELLSIIQELQQDLADIQQGQQVMAMGNGEAQQLDLISTPQPPKA